MNKGLDFTSEKIFEMYTPIIPNINIWTPPINIMEASKLAHPVTAKPSLLNLMIIQAITPKLIELIKIPR